MMRSLIATWTVVLLSDHPVQGYRVDNKKLMTSPESVLARTKAPAPNVLHTLGDVDGLEQAKEGERAAEVERSAKSALIDSQAVNTSAEVEPSAASALLDSQAVNTSAKSEETMTWEPQGIMVKIGYLRSKLVLHVASSFLPKSMVQNFPAMDAKVFDVPVTSGPYLGLSWNTIYGKVIFICLIAGTILAIGFLVKFYASIVAARAKPATEGDDDSLSKALGEVVGLALPMLIAAILQMINEMTNTIILGQNGTPVELASLGLVQSLYNCGIITISMGLNSVMDTVVSQAYGAGDQALCMTYMQRCRFLVICLLVVVLPLFWFSEPILLLFGQEPDVALRTAVPARLFWFGGFWFQMTSVSFIFLKNIGDLSTIWMFAACNIVHLGCAFYFALHLEMGVVGIGIAMAAQNFTLSLFMHYHLVFKSAVKDFALVQKIFATVDSMNGLLDYIVIGIPAALSSACESWYWELNTVTIGWLGSVSLAAHSSTTSLVGTAMIICACTAGSGTTLVSRALGSGHPRAARAISFYSIVTIMSMWFVCAIILLVFDRQIARAFNGNAEVLSIMYTLIHIQAFASFLACGQLIAGSVLKAMLKHRMVAFIQCFNYYICALPIGYLLAFKADLGVAGTYVGFLVGMMLAAVTLIGVLSTVDFDKMTAETKARLDKDAAPKKVDESKG